MGNWSRSFKIAILLVAVIACIVAFMALKVRPEPYETSDFQPAGPLPPPADAIAPAPTDTQTKPVAASSGCVPGEERTENGVVFVRICSGTFTVGSANDHSVNGWLAAPDERPAHQVTVSEFWIGKTEITREQHRRFHPDYRGDVRPFNPMVHHFSDAMLPATWVNWLEAKETCERLGGRLPTEAEWEYAARAGSQTAWSMGDDKKLLGEYAWYDGSLISAPHTVGTKKPNAWGLHDMHGNVQEWVADWYGTYPAAAQTDPVGPKTGRGFRVLRGGSYFAKAPLVRSARRNWEWPPTRLESFGFRCVRSFPRK